MSWRLNARNWPAKRKTTVTTETTLPATSTEPKLEQVTMPPPPKPDAAERPAPKPETVTPRPEAPPPPVTRPREVEPPKKKGKKGDGEP